MHTVLAADHFPCDSCSYATVSPSLRTYLRSAQPHSVLALLGRACNPNAMFMHMKYRMHAQRELCVAPGLSFARLVSHDEEAQNEHSGADDRDKDSLHKGSLGTLQPPS